MKRCLPAFALLAMTLPARAGTPQEHAAMVALVDPAKATSTAVISGPWSDPHTWGGIAPVREARIVIPVGRVVTVDGLLAGTPYDWIGVEGTLVFARNRPVSLSVNTIVVHDMGTFDAGTDTDPVSSARIVFHDNGPIDPLKDPTFLGRGLIVHGMMTVCGTPVTPCARVQGCAAGATALTLLGPVTGWAAGNRIILPGVSTSKVDDDEAIISAIAGNTVALATPLTYAHPTTAQRPMLACLLDRAVTFESENPAIDRRGHVMAMHTRKVMVCHARFKQLGRTDKSKPLTGANARGRYSFHVHRAGGAWTDTPAVIEACVADGSPGWGLVNHSSYCRYKDCVTYRTFGAGLVSEAGDEIGSFDGCVAIRSMGIGHVDPLAVTQDRANSDYGHLGYGIWCQSPLVDLIGNYCTGHKHFGIAVVPAPFIQDGALVTVPKAAIRSNIGVPGVTGTANPQFVPMYAQDNTVWGCKGGLTPWGLFYRAGRQAAPRRSVIRGGYLEAEAGLVSGYAYNVDIEGVTIVQALPQLTGYGVGHTGIQGSWDIRGCEIKGFKYGIQPGTDGSSLISGCRLGNLVDIYVQCAREANRSLQIDANQTALPVSAAQLAAATINPFQPIEAVHGRNRWNVFMAADNYHMSLYRTQSQREWPAWFGCPSYAVGMDETVKYGGQYLHYRELDPAWPLTACKYLPAFLRQKPDGTPMTPADLWTLHKIRLGGWMMPGGLTTTPGIFGVLSASPHVRRPALQVSSLHPFYAYPVWDDFQKTDQASYSVKVKDAAGAFVTAGPFTLAPNAWTVCPVTANGQTYGVPVYRDTSGAPVTPPW